VGLKAKARGRMKKTKISSADLAWIFTDRLLEFGDCSSAVTIAIIPDDDRWIAVTSAKYRVGNPLCAKRIEQVQKQLREVYALLKD
jgi:hypothetical protein